MEHATTGRAGAIGEQPSGGAPQVIRAPGRWPGLGLREMWRYRSICLVLARRNLKVRYRQTLIGATWSVLQPIALMAVFTIFFGLLARVPTDGLPFAVFFYLGLMPWQMVAKILNEGTTSVISNSGLVTRVYFPRTYFPISVALASLVDLLLAGIALVILLVIFRVVPGLAVVALPVLVGVAWMSALGVTLWLSALNVAYRDVTQMLPFLIQLWMFGSPIIYPSSLIPESFRLLYFLNPIALVVEGFRWAIAHAPAPPLEAWVAGGGVAILLLVSGFLVFRRREPYFADII
jgi:homopolymeric O-antigen transport system permease protein